MKQKQYILVVCLTFLSATVLAADERSEAIEGFRKEIQICKTSPDQEIAFDLATVPGKPASEPATPEEAARIKDLLAKSNMPYDPVNHRATYEFTLALIRVKNVAVFKVTSPKKESDLSAVRKCLGEMASSGGLEYKFE